MKLTIRKENPEDFKAVFNLIEKAFENEQMSDHKEQFLVERLRKSNAFVPELSMVAETENKIVGHILLTKLKIKNKTNEFDSLALAPVSVLPEFQGKGMEAAMVVHFEDIVSQPDFPYKTLELNWIGDFNPTMMKVSKMIGGQEHKKHTTYRMPIVDHFEFHRAKVVNK